MAKMIEANKAQVVALARTQIGYSERPPHSNRTKYNVWYGMNPAAWCAIFDSWVSHHSGNPLPHIRTSKGYAYTPDLQSYARRTGQLKSAGYNPSPGDKVLFSFGGQRVDHVGIVGERGRLRDGRIHTIEGNTNAAGSRTGGSVLEKYRGSNIVNIVAVKAKVEAIDWAALRRLAAAKVREQYGAAPNMKQGHKACCEVVALQQALNLVSGVGLVEDGQYGPKTTRAVANFQKWMNALGAGIKDPAGQAHEGTRWWLCMALQSIRDGKA